MTDYIEREKAINIGYKNNNADIVADLRAIPSADVVERSEDEPIIEYVIERMSNDKNNLLQNP